MSLNEHLTKTLAMYNLYRLLPGCELNPHPHEIGYIEDLRETVASEIPTSATLEWYENLLHTGPGQNDPLHQFLAERATEAQMKWFLTQEASGEAGFDDLVAMTQVKMPTQVKLEMANNYWDEMGQGHEHGMHNGLLKGILEYFGIEPLVEKTVAESLLLSNLMIGLAFHRRYAYQAVGALGVIEMTAPGRVSLVDQGLDRLGVPKKDRQYFSLHAALDIKHSRDWNREVIAPLAELGYMQAMAEGAYLRLWAGARCFERYRREFGI